MTRARAFLIGALLAVAAAAVAPAPTLTLSALSGREEAKTQGPSYEGTAANAPIPAEYHIRNEGGSDGAGLCVVSSILANGQYQEVPGLEGGKQSRLWQAAKDAPGGYYPEKLAELVERVMPGEKYASFLDTDPNILAKLSAAGYPVGITMNTGELYDWEPIHHMVSLVHYDEANDLACHVDNNSPGIFTWTRAKEIARRWIDGGTGWAWIWTRLPGGGVPPELEELGPIVITAVAAAIVVVSSARPRRLAA